MAERKAFLLRLPTDVLEAMQRWARDDLRSLNAQIEFVLREALRQQRRTKQSEDARHVAPIAAPHVRAPWQEDPPESAANGERGDNDARTDRRSIADADSG